MTAVLSLPPVSKRDYVTPETLRALLKSNLGLNARKVSVRQGSSIRYLTIVVRDPSVDVAAVEAFANHFYTWTMDNTDYCEGQSVSVDLSDGVHAAFVARFKDEILASLDEAKAQGGKTLSNGKLLRHSWHGYHVENGEKRGTYVQDFDVDRRTPWAVDALALQAAQV